MKGFFAAAAVAAMAGVASASHRHAHDLFAKRNVTEASTCIPGCTTIYHTITGEPTLVPVTVTTATRTNTTTVTCSTTEAAATSTVIVIPMPTPEAHTCPTPGTYTFPATTVTVSETTTVCGATSTKLPSGTHTVGGVTTVVVTATTITCPVATVSTSGSVTTSTISMTEYVCPSAGTYTVAPITVTVTEETVIVYPVPTTVCPGTYTAPETVVTVTETDYTTYCPYTSVGLPTTSAAPPPPPATTQAPAPAPPAVKVQIEKPAPKPAAPAPAPKKNIVSQAVTALGSLVGNNNHLGITYTPYDSISGHCKSAQQVDDDIKELKGQGFETVRVYSTDCSTLENVGGACEKHGINMIIGVFVKNTGCSYDSPDVKEQVDAIANWAQWDMVKLFVIGNEAIMNNFCSPSELRDLITTVKSKCSGYKGRYTISETLNIWQRSDVSSAICGVVDVTAANIHPFFNADVSPESAGDFVQSQLNILADVCPGNDVVNLECGWPTRGKPNGKAIPGDQEQKTAIDSIRKKCGDKVVFFSFENDMWKEDGECECERSWGSKSCFTS